MTNVKIVCRVGPPSDLRKMPQSARATKPFTLQNSAVNKKSSKALSRITAAHSSVNSRVNGISAYSRSNANIDIQLRSKSIKQHEGIESPKSRNQSNNKKSLSHKRSKSNEEAKKKEIRSKSHVPRTIDNTSISIGLNSYRSSTNGMLVGDA